MEISNNCKIVRERQKYLETITQFVEEKKQQLNKVLEKLGLSEEELLKNQAKTTCPYNKDHIVPTNSFKKHVEKCRLLSAGYQIDELPTQLQDVDFCYENLESIMKIEIDENSLNKIIWDHSVQNGQVYTGHRSMPNSYIEENTMLTQEDRLAVYKHVVKKSHEAGKVILVDRSDELLTTDWSSLVKKGLLDEQNNKQYSSKLEQLAALRDLKRRRQSYRAKNVHITKKSYTEIIREVIYNQMEILVPGNSSVLESTIQEESTDNMSERQDSSRDESRDRDRRSEYSPGKRGDDGKWRSKDRRLSSERNKQRERSEGRHSNWTGRDTRRSKERAFGGERSKTREDRDISKAREGRERSNTREDRERWQTREDREKYKRREDREISKTQEDNETSKTQEDREITNTEEDKDKIQEEINSQTSSFAKARFTEAYDMFLKEIKQEAQIDDVESNMTTPSTDGAGCEMTKEVVELIDGSHINTNKSDKSPKRRRSDSDSGSRKNYGKHKKSKHKKKHSKKHKKRD